MPFVIKCTDRKGPNNYVSPAGSKKSYTFKSIARRFDTKGEAEINLCPGNEVIEEVTS